MWKVILRTARKINRPTSPCACRCKITRNKPIPTSTVYIGCKSGCPRADISIANAPVRRSSFSRPNASAIRSDAKIRRSDSVVWIHCSCFRLRRRSRIYRRLNVVARRSSCRLGPDRVGDASDQNNGREDGKKCFKKKRWFHMLDSRLPMPFGDHGGLSFNQVYFYDTPPRTWVNFSYPHPVELRLTPWFYGAHPNTN